MFLFRRPRYYLEEVKTDYKVKVYLNIQYLEQKDLGTYKCSASNSMGSANGSIRVYGK